MAYPQAKPILDSTVARAPWCFTKNRANENKPVYHVVPLEDAQAKALFAEYLAIDARKSELESALTAIAESLAVVSSVTYQGESKPMIPQGFSCRVGFKFDRVSVWAVEGESHARAAKSAKANPSVTWGPSTPATPELPAVLIRKGKKVA